MLKDFTIVIAAGLGLSVAACGPEGPTRADTGLAVGALAGGLIGNSVGKGTGRALATVAGAFVGGVVGHEIGKSLDERDRMLAREAEYDALEHGDSGVARTWRNPDNGRYGEVVPSRHYRRGTSDCRDYAHTVYIDGRPEVLRGTACRDRDGGWRSVA
ncbi:MAG TPA: RT0821/Lpp0805 family surface protein [Hyphomicrobiaceae bacterium]|nr:RT0821/Lpp0805 family surface protein [Hyphomicrobiaceae bacterium]